MAVAIISVFAIPLALVVVDLFVPRKRQRG